MNNEQTNNNNMEIHYRSVLLNLEQAAKTNRFSTKEEYNKYIEGLKKNGMPESIMTEEKQKELLELYDEYHKVEEPGLDMQNYKGVELSEQNYIASTKKDTILKTDSSKEELPQEFKNVQNEITAATNSDGLANADAVYEHMKDNQKEEVSLISLYEVVSRDNISTEVLNKIKFFVTNKYINPYEYKIDPETGIFYNMETDEMLEVVKNAETGKYEIKKGGEVIYKDDNQRQELNSDNITNDNNQEKEKDTDEEEQIYENGMGKLYSTPEETIQMAKPKVRRLVPPKDNHGQAAFAKTSFLIIVSIFIALAIASLILLIK